MSGGIVEVNGACYVCNCLWGSPDNRVCDPEILQAANPEELPEGAWG